MNQSIYIERENIQPHHAEWLDGCGAVWWINRVRFSLRHDISEVSFIAFCVSDNTFLTSYDESYTHIPTGTEFCECVAEILGLPKPTFEVDISKKETTTEPIKGMAIEASRLSESDKKSLSMPQYSFQTSIKQAIKNNLCVGFWSFGSSGFSDKNFYKSAGFTITESPAEFLKYVAQQTGKEYKKEWGQTHGNPRTSQPVSESYKFKTYRILDSLDNVPLDKRIPLSEWIPPVGKKVLLITKDWFMDGYFDRVESKIIFETVEGSKAFSLDGHWMRIV